MSSLCLAGFCRVEKSASLATGYRVPCQLPVEWLISGHGLAGLLSTAAPIYSSSPDWLDLVSPLPLTGLFEPFAF